MNTKKFLHALLLVGMSLMIPCYLFTALNTLFSPWELYNRNHALLLMLTALGMAGLILALRTADRQEAFFARHEKKILIFAAVFYFAVQMIMAHLLRFIPKTDAEQCFTAAQLLVDTGTFGNNERSFIYFTRYPHNLGFVYALAAIFRFFGMLGWTDRFMQAVLVSSILFTCGMLAGARAVRSMGGIKAQMRMLILFASCLPFLYCTTELYTDAFSMSFPLMTVYAFCRLKNSSTGKKRMLWALLFALITFIGAQIRFTAVVAAIACIIALIFEKHGKSSLLALAATLIVFVIGGQAVDQYTYRHLSKEDITRNELPKLHYIAMGLPVQIDEGYGQYGTGGWLIFSTSFEDPQARKAALLEEVIDRIYYLRYPNRLLHMMSRKNISTFGNGTFLLNEIIEADAPHPDNPVKQTIFETGAAYPAYYHLTTTLFVSQMLLACLACVQALRRRDTCASALFITLTGIFILLSCWETRGRYFFQYVPVLLCAAAMYEYKPISSRKNVLPE